jgi:hypothetical protein
MRPAVNLRRLLRACRLAASNPKEIATGSLAGRGYLSR